MLVSMGKASPALPLIIGACKRSSSPATNKAARAWNSEAMKREAMSAICSVSKAPDNSRDISYSARARLSRCVDTSAWYFKPAVSWPTTSATNSITAKVTTYCASDTANVKRGGT